MEDFIWRHRARIAGYVDLIVSAIWGIMVFLLAVVVGYVAVFHATSTSELTSLIESAERRNPVGIWVMWLLVAVLALVTGLHLLASLMLLSATEIGRDLNKAFVKAQIWQCVTFAFIIMTVMEVLAVLTEIGVVGWTADRIIAGAVGVAYVIWRSISLFIVHKFVAEIGTALASGTTASVVFKKTSAAVQETSA